MKRCLVTGGAGFIGSHLATRLVKSGWRVRVLDNLSTGSLANLLRSGVTSSWRISLTHDTRDNKLFPHSGWHNTISAEFAEPAFFSENQYSRFEGVARYFYPLVGPLVLRLRSEGGLITSRDPQGVPIYERYFLGGIFDVRGFQLYSLSPQIRVPADQNPDAGLNVLATPASGTCP